MKPSRLTLPVATVVSPRTAWVAVIPAPSNAAESPLLRSGSQRLFSPGSTGLVSRSLGGFLAALLLAAPAAAPMRAGAQCMQGLIESMSASCSSNKCGYLSDCDTNYPQTCYLQRVTVNSIGYSETQFSNYTNLVVSESGSASTTFTETMGKYPRTSSQGGCVLWSGPVNTMWSGSSGITDHINSGNSCGSSITNQANGDWSDQGYCYYTLQNLVNNSTGSGSTRCLSSNVCLEPWAYNAWDNGYQPCESTGYAYLTNCISYSNVFKTDDLRGDIIGGLPPSVPYPSTNWSFGSGVAQWRLDPCEFCASGGCMQYRVGICSSVTNLTYQLNWYEVVTDLSNNVITNIPMQVKLQGTGVPGPLWSGTNTVGVPSTNCIIMTSVPEVTILDPSDPGGSGGTPGSGGPGGSPPTRGCSTCGGGGARASDLGPFFQVSLGTAQFGQPAGNLFFGKTLPDSGLFKPAGLQFDSSRQDVAVQRNSDGTIRQVYAPLALADVPPPPTTNGYVINFYYPSQVSSQPVNGVYVVSGTPFTTWTITNLSVDGSTYQVSQSSPPPQVINQWGCSFSAGAWTVQPLGNAVQRTVAMTPLGPGLFQVIETLQAPAGQAAKRVKKTYQLFGWGWAVTQISDGSDTAPETTTYAYNDPVPGAAPWAPPPLATAAYPDGSWTTCDSRDPNGNPTSVAASFGDWDERQTLSTYDPVAAGVSASGDDGSLSPELPRLVSQVIDGAEVSRAYTVFPATGVRLDIQCTGAGAGWTNAGNLFTTNLFFTGGGNLNALRAVIHPDHTATFYNYTNSADGNYKTNITATGQPDTAYTHIIDGVSNVVVLNLAGYAVLSASYDALTGIPLAQDVYTNFDNFLRPGQVTHLDGTTEQTFYDCCGVSSTLDRDGVTTQYLHDAANRPTGYQKIFSDNSLITFTNVLDAAGQILQAIRIGTNGSMVTNYQAQYDQAGELLYETNPLGGVTSHSRSYASTGGLVLTTVYPDGGTRIEAYYVDGSLKQVTGTAVHPVAYQYGAGWSQETKLDGNGNATGEWTQTYTDVAGRTVETYYPDGASSQFFYNAQGQLSGQTDPDHVATLYQYNPKGEREYTVVDMNQNGQIDLGGPDRITRLVATNDFVSLLGGSGNVRRTYSYVWVDGSSTPLCLSTNEVSADSLRSWSRSPAGLSRSRTIYAANGARYTTNAAPDNSYSVSAYQNGRLAWTKQFDALNNPLSGTTNGYDPQGRLGAVTDARNGTTTLMYNNADLVATNITPNPGTPGASPQVTATFYNQRLQATNVLLPDGHGVTNTYFLTGELQQTAGARTYPVAYTYDYAGRMATITTWTNFANNQGAATTTWNYDPYRGWLNNKSYADSTGPTYAYTPGGRLNTRTWARGITTTYSYDNAGALSTVTYNDGVTPAIAYTYDRRGRQTQVVVGGAATTAFTYNNANHVLSESYTGGDLAGLAVTNGYDQYLRRTALAALSGTTPLLQNAFAYDPASRLQTVSAGTVGATYTYLANSPLVGQITFTNSGALRMTTTKQYDFLNRLNQISSAPSAASAVTFNYLYNSANQRTARTNADGSAWIYGYDSLGQVTSGKKYWADATPVAGQQFQYAFDDIGNRTSTGAGGDSTGSSAALRTASYQANNLNQYASRDVPGAVDVMGLALATNTTLTVNGQTPYKKVEYFRQQLNVANGANPVWQSVTVSAANETTVTGGVFVPQTPEPFTYDPDGNLLTDGRWNYTWDAENRLLQMAANTAVGPVISLQFDYDWRGRRIRKQVWPNAAWNGNPTNDVRFLYDGWNLVGTLNAALTLQTSFLWGLDLSGSPQGAGGVGGLLAVEQVSNAQVTNCSLAACDGNGNVAALVSAAAGTNAAQFEYGPFAELLRATGPMAKANPFRFSTKYQDDETDLLYYGYRYYNPSTGRWLSRDPVEENGGNNLYGMLRNDPIDFIDILGLKKLNKEEGDAAIRKGLAMLGSACDSACVKSCCGPKGCKKEAQTLVDLLVAAWKSNWGKGPGNDNAKDSDTVGGYFCWDWARIFQDAAAARKFNCISFTYGMAVKDVPPDAHGKVPVHYYLKVYACKRVSDAYRVSFDDGFFDGQNSAHSGAFPSAGSSYKDTNPPWPFP